MEPSALGWGSMLETGAGTLDFKPAALEFKAGALGIKVGSLGV